MMRLAYGFSFDDFYTRQGLSRMDAVFIKALAEADAALHNRLLSARNAPEKLSAQEYSALIMEVAPHVEDFLAELFGITAEVNALRAEHHTLAPLFACKRLFVQRRAAKAVTAAQAQSLSFTPRNELEFAREVMGWLADEGAHKPQLEEAQHYAAWALHHPEGRKAHANSVLFQLPHKFDPQALIALETEMRDGVTVLKLPRARQRLRQGFALTDPGGTLTQALDQAHYCIYCHHQGRDSCRSGMKEKDGSLKKNPLDITLNGCPLDEKISEMNELKAAGVPLGALAVITIDNPMCAGTGHRICNDCMKSCIYQKQEPVNIPLAETRTLSDVLSLPWGFEIYSLLTRWNPLNLARPLPKPATGKRVLVAGLGPAGYTLAHHLMNDGHTVVGVDGLKIEPLPDAVLCEPVRDIEMLYERLDERVLAGFGGVAEYGITVRWDKNYLKIIRLLLERRAQFRLFGGVRFGSGLTYESAFALGFDHIALCMGAGRPTMPEIPGGVARGVRAASDFLMSLQLTGAAKKDSIANLQVRLPVVVIGGGLTAIDTATEALAYYPVQVEKFLTRYEALVQERGGAAVRMRWNEEERIIADEFIAHAKALRNAKPHEIPELLEKWGGVKIVYRRRLIDSPSYRLNHEEVEKAFEEGIFFSELWDPQAVDVDQYGHACALTLKQAGGEATKTLTARTILVAAGTSPNTVLAREHPAHFALDGKYFRAVDEEGNAVAPERVAKPSTVQVLMSVEADGRAVSFFGDLHPSFAGNVVKAMGSAKQGYPAISCILEKMRAQPALQNDEAFLHHVQYMLKSTVRDVRRLTPTIVEVIVHAPLAAAAFQPGQFYRLQNYEANALRTADTVLAMEGLAMTGAWVDADQGLVSVIALEMGGSSDLCTHLQRGEEVVLMGPTGAPTEIPQGETVLLAGGGLGNAVLFSIGCALRAAGCKVLYFAGYKALGDRYKAEEIEAAADIVVWCCDEAPGFAATRPQDKSFTGNIVEAMLAYAEGRLETGNRKWETDFPPLTDSHFLIPLSSVNRIIAIGSDRMMQAVARARHEGLARYLGSHEALGSINSPMQCMMKEICAQCLQQHVDPMTGKITYVYSCFNQDQKLDAVSFPHLAQRLRQNSVQEKLTAQWIDRCLRLLGQRGLA